MLDKHIQTLEVKNLDEFLNTQIPIEMEIEFKAHNKNPLYKIAEFQKKRLENMMKEKIKATLDNDSYRFDDWQGNKKQFAELIKKDNKYFLEIWEKRF